MKSKTYLSILLRQFRSDTPIYSDNLILAAKINAYSDRLTFIEFLSQPNFREQEFIQKFDWQKQDFKYGLEFAFNMESNGGHIENAQIILNSSTINGLQFFYDFIQNEYLELCNLQNNPFWLFPLWEEFHKTNNLQFMNNLSPFLQGIFLYFVWKEILQNNQKRIYSLEQFLTITYEQLPVKAFMIFVGKVTEPLIRKSFDIRHQEKIDINKRLLNQLLQWMAQTIGKETLENEIIEIYLHNLKGKVNRESWLAALYFANKLEELDHSIANDNAHLIRIKVLDSYPNIWLHGNAKNHNFLSGEKSIAMISELAVAILKLYKNQAFEIYWSYSRIVAPPRLWHLQNIYEHNTYTNKRTLIFIHSLLLAKMLEKSVFPPQMIERFHSYIKLIFRQITVNHIYPGEQLVVQHLLGTLGVLYEKSDILTKAAPELIKIIAFPGYSVYFLRRLNKNSNTYADILQLVEEKLEIDLMLMRKKERVMLAHELYHIGAWLQCCKVVKDSNLIEHTVNSRYENMVLLYGSAALQNISNNKNEQIQNEYLKDALSEITHYQRENPYTKKKKMTILRGYLVEKLYEKNQLDFVTLVNEYMTLQQQSAEGLKDEATLSYVKLLLLVHLIHDSSDDSQFKNFIAESKELFKKITPLSELDETKAILQAWVANQTNKKNIQDYLKKAHTQLSDVNKHVNYLPKPVREFAKTFLAED